MNHFTLLHEHWISNSEFISAELSPDGLVVTNSSNAELGIWTENAIPYPSQFAQIQIKGNSISGNAATFAIVDNLSPAADIQPRKASLNSTCFFPLENAMEGTPTFLAPPHSKTLITELTIDFKTNEDEQYDFLMKGMTADILVVTPTYPAPEDRYLSAFAHSRLVAYKQAGIRFDVACSYQYKGDCRYEFEGITVTRMPFADLRKVLRRKRYNKILVHFFDERYALLFDSCDIGNAELLLWCHNPELRYWDSPYYTAKYFEPIPHLTEKQRVIYAQKDAVVKRYNRMANVTWIFVSEFQKTRCEQLIGISFNRYRIIPNVIDEQVFKFEKKDPSLRKRIFLVRRFDNIASYSIDICIRTIVELSRRPFFKDLEFDLYGSGDYFEVLTEPIRNFNNVHLHQQFITHDEIAAAHKNHGIALFPTRFDSQGVSAGEAAMSGLAVISSKIDAAEYFLPSDIGLLKDPNNHIEFANTIERLYRDERYFLDCSKACYEKCYELCRREKTIGKEIELITSRNDAMHEPVNRVKADADPVLTVVVPSFNVKYHLPHGVKTLLAQPYAHYLEIIIVDLGSNDGTAEIAHRLMSAHNDPSAPIIKFINANCGGYGSAINAGLTIAKGRYCRIMNGSDWFDSDDFAKCLERLKAETADVVVMNYSEDHAISSIRVSKHFYDFMVPYLQYNFDDVCFGSYGFKASGGPQLKTGCYKTQMLRETNFELLEHSLFTNSMFNALCIIKARSISYYPLNVYRHFIDRPDQTTSTPYIARNFEDHERAILNILQLLDDPGALSQNKRSYLIHSLLLPEINTHYAAARELPNGSPDLTQLDNALKQLPEIYFDPAFPKPKEIVRESPSAKPATNQGLPKALIQLVKTLLKR